jgi:hypothetical protein
MVPLLPVPRASMPKPAFIAYYTAHEDHHLLIAIGKLVTL